MLRPSLFAALAAVIAACSSTPAAQQGDAGPPDASPPLDPIAECVRLKNREITCNMQDGAVVVDPGHIRDWCARWLALPGVKMTGEQIRRCADAVGPGCALQGASPACDIRGTLPDLEACDADAQCASGLCIYSTGTHTCGVCGHVVERGGECVASTCARGLSCVDDHGVMVVCMQGLPSCPKGTCVDYCKADASCPSGQRCGGDCLAPRASPGESCASMPCVYGAECVGGTCVAPSPRRVGPGQACDPSNGVDCIAGRCPTTGARICPPQPADGEACAAPLSSCGELSTCDTGVCRTSFWGCEGITK